MPITGFLQHLGQPNGFLAIWQAMRVLQDADREVVTPMPWNSRWSELADTIFRCRDASVETVIRVYAYSYGAGWGAMKLAEELKQRGLRVAWMVLSDAVYRSDWICGRLQAMLPFSMIVVPDNVRRVTWYRQGVTRPRGHDVVAADPAVTDCSEAYRLHVPHTEMDDAPEFHAKCQEIAAHTPKFMRDEVLGLPCPCPRH